MQPDPQTQQPAVKTQTDRIEELLSKINMKLGFITGIVLIAAMIFGLLLLCRLTLPDAPWW